MGTSGLLLLLLAVATAALQPPASQEVGYAFEYGVRDERSGSVYGHTEFRHGLVTTGQYTVHLPDGRIQTVKYTADHDGYRATVSYEGLAHHPDKIIDNPSKTTNYPPTLAGRPVPVVGRTALNRPSTISQAASVSHTAHRYSGHSHETSTSDNRGLLTPVSPLIVPSVPTSVKKIPVGSDFSPNLAGFQATSTHSGNFQRGNQYSGAPTHLVINSNVTASHGRDPNSYSPSRQNLHNAFSFERPYDHSFSTGISGDSDRYSSFSVPLHQDQDTSLQTGTYPTGSFPPNRHPNDSKLRYEVPVVPFTINGITLVPSTDVGAPVVPLVQESISNVPYDRNVALVPSSQENIPVVPHTSSRVIVPTVPFIQDPSQRNPLYSFPNHSRKISTDSLLPTSVSHDKHSLAYSSQNSRPQIPVRNSFRVPHKLQSGEQDFTKIPQSFNFNRQNTFSSSNTQNFNEFYSLPSSPQTRTRKFPPNTFIPSAIDPLGPPDNAIPTPTGHGSTLHQGNEFPSRGNHLNQQISPHLHRFELPGLSRFAATDLHKPPSTSFSSAQPGYQYGALNSLNYLSSISHQNRPFNPNNVPSVPGAKFENSNQIGLNYNLGGESGSVPNNLPSQNANSIFIAHDSNNRGASQNYSVGESSQPGRPTPRPFIIPNHQSLQSPETEYSSGGRSPYTTDTGSQNVIFRPINEIEFNVFREPFKIDPEASVFHNEPSIIVDYSHSVSSDESDSNTLTAPYVFVGGAYSPNPASEFGVNVTPVKNIFTRRRIAPPDAAATVNIVLSPGFLPPHLAKLQKHREEIRTVPTPEPVQLKLAQRRNLEIHGVERKNLPLRNQPDTFGEGTIHTFIPNSLSKTSKKQRRNILNASNITSTEQISSVHGSVLNNTEAQVESSPTNIEIASQESRKIETKPRIRRSLK